MSTDTVEKIETAKDSIIEIKKGMDVPLNQLYYGYDYNGYREVFINTPTPPDRRVRFNKVLVFYQKSHIDKKTGEIYKLAHFVKCPPKRVEENWLYPVAVWNISPTRLDIQDNIPFWQLRTVIDDNSGVVYIKGVELKCFHYVVVNDRYVPNIRPNGSSDDGNWQPGEPVIGSWINEKLDAEEAIGSNPMDYRRT